MARRMQAFPIAATCDQPQCRHRGYHDEFQSCDRESRPYCPGPCRPVEREQDDIERLLDGLEDAAFTAGLADEHELDAHRANVKAARAAIVEAWNRRAGK